jgi:hypothetical protein
MYVCMYEYVLFMVYIECVAGGRLATPEYQKVENESF